MQRLIPALCREVKIKRKREDKRSEWTYETAGTAPATTYQSRVAEENCVAAAREASNEAVTGDGRGNTDVAGRHRDVTPRASTGSDKAEAAPIGKHGCTSV
jgi:hypothetical protein